MLRRRQSDDQLATERFQEYLNALIEQDGIKPLGPGELRPPGYYMVSRLTPGRKPVDVEAYRARHKNDKH